MEGTTRTGYCLLEADPQQIEVFTSSLDMGAPQHLAAAEGFPFPAFLRDSPCVVRFPSEALDEVRAYLIAGRPDQLRLAQGGQFEYLMIVFDPATYDACIQASYSYG